MIPVEFHGEGSDFAKASTGEPKNAFDHLSCQPNFGNIPLIMKLSSNVIIFGTIVVVIAGIIGINIWQKNKPSSYDDFAQCITDKGGKMYGAYWCPHCTAQKNLFGSAFRKINYVECSSPGSKTFDLCSDIETVPVWETSTGLRQNGEMTFQQLSEKFDCALPTITE